MLCISLFSLWVNILYFNGLSLNINKTYVIKVNLNYFKDDPFKALYMGKKINNKQIQFFLGGGNWWISGVVLSTEYEFE
jgi:hypothetical protein